MPHRLGKIEVLPLGPELRKETELGAEVILPSSMPLLDVSALTHEDEENLKAGLFEHQVLVIRNQEGIDPAMLPRLARIFDPTLKEIHSGGKNQVTDEKNILSQNNCSRIPRAPQVTVIGSGNTAGHEGIQDLELKHVDHTSCHESPLSSEEVANGYSRPNRWHMDAPLYENLPGFATMLHCIEAPNLPDQKIKFPNDEDMLLAAGATAFYSGARGFNLLTSEEQDFALNTTVQYAPRAYEFIRHCKATDDGLSIVNAGQEMQEADLTPFEWSKVHAFPMVWRNKGTGRPHLQILGCNVFSLHTKDPRDGSTKVIDDLAEVRRICHGLQSKVYRPEYIFAHRWQKGDLVIFHNRGVLHSITGQIANRPERRLLWQCSMASGTPPEAYTG